MLPQCLNAPDPITLRLNISLNSGNMRPHGQGNKYRKFTVEYKGIIQIVKHDYSYGSVFVIY